MKLQKYNYDTNKMEDVVDFSLRTIAKNMSPQDFADLLDDYANAYASSFERGRETGKELCKTHRTLQRSVIVELVGVIAGLADQQHTDARNAQAIALAKKIAALAEEEGFGPFV